MNFPSRLTALLMTTLPVASFAQSHANLEISSKKIERKDMSLSRVDSSRSLETSKLSLGIEAKAFSQQKNLEKSSKLKNEDSKNLRDSLREGTNSGGGGVGFACHDESGKTKVYLADTYQLVQSGDLDVLTPSEPGAIVAAAAQLIETLIPRKVYPHPYLPEEKVSIGWMINHMHAQLSFGYAQTLDLLGDDHLPAESIPHGCEKIQLAVQNIPGKRVAENLKYLHQMSFLDRGFLEFHEALIALRAMPGADTTPIRQDVDTIARLMRESRHIKQVLEIVQRSRIPYYANDPEFRPFLNEIDKSFTANCGSWAEYSKPQPQDSPQKIGCREATKLRDVAIASYMAKTAIPSLLKMPSEMNCVTTYKGSGNSQGIQQPEKVSLKLVSGEGRISTQFTDVYELTMSSERSLPQIQSRRIDFSASSHDRAEGFREFGMFNFDVEFKDQQGKLVTLFLRTYDPMTEEMYGSIQMSDPTVLDNPGGYFGLSCYVGKLQFGHDPEPRTVGTPPWNKLPAQCKQVLDASSITRVQYLHKLKTFNDMNANDPQNREALKQWKQLGKQMHDLSIDNFSSIAEYLAKSGQLKQEQKALEAWPLVKLWISILDKYDWPLECVTFNGD